MFSNVNDAMLRQMPLALQMALLGPEKAMEFQRRQLTNKITRKIRELPGTENAYKKELRKKVTGNTRQLASLIKATGQADYASALAWIKRQQREGR